MSIFEAAMLLCFGAAWPLSIYKSYTARANNGKSLPFLLVIVVGYICGITNKVLYNYDIVLYLYILNLCMVSVDAMLYVRNKKLEKIAKQEAGNV